MYDVAIIGGGASGLFAAAVAAERGLSVLLLEKNTLCGRKIALTGKGRCNLTNNRSWDEFSLHIHPKSSFFKSAFFSMSNIMVMEFFERIGLPLVVERGARVFPASMCAKDVTAVLLSYLEKSGVRVMTDFEVGSIERSGSDSLTWHEDAPRFVINRVNETGAGRAFAASNIIICTGGLSYPATGSTGSGYRFAKLFGHTVIPCFPSLTALVPKGYSSDYHGISLKNIEASLYINGNKVASEQGDLDFTNGGIEGPLGFRLSRQAVYNLRNGQKVSLVIDLKPALSLKQLESRIAREVDALLPGRRQEISKNESKGVQYYILPKLLPKVLIHPFVSANGKVTLSSLPTQLKEWTFPIVSNVGYERCVVTAGGVALEEISQKRMESKLVKGLYFAGEVLDLDGDTGGYNLQIAFSTGALAAMSIASTLQKKADS